MLLQYKINIKRIILFAIGLIFLLNLNSIIKAETNKTPINISESLPEYSELDAGHITFYQKVNNNAIDANLKSTIENGISNPNRGYEIYYLKDNVTQYLQDDVYVKNSDNNWYRFTPEVNINNGKKEVNYNITGVYTDSAMKSNMLETSSVKKIEGANGTYYKIDLKDGNGTFSGSIYTYKDKNGNYQKIDENDYNEILNSNTISELQNQSILGKEQADLSMDLSTGAVVRSGSDETDPIIHLDAGGQSSNYSSIKSIVNSIDAYCVDELEYSDKNPILSYYSDGNLTFNVKGYNSLKDKNKTKFFEFSFNIIDNFGLSNVQIRGKFKNFLKEQDPGLSKNIELLNSNVGEELSVAESWMKGPNKLVSKIIGILTVIIFIMLIFSLVVDLTYISLPVVRDVADVVGNGMDKLLHKKDTSYKKPFFISEEAYSSVADAETNTAKTSAILLYLRRRIVIIIIISTGTIFIATGTIYDFISFIIDIFLEVRG